MSSPLLTLVDFYPRPPRGGRHRRCHRMSLHKTISIHALREEGDMAALSRSTPSWGFLSTPSARRATHGNAELESSMDISIHALREESDPRLLLSCLRESGNFYPRPPRGERLHGYSKSESSMDISIHALREESDANTVKQRVYFLISIHALREESDYHNYPLLLRGFYFYPRPPRGERPEHHAESRTNLDFYPRPPRGERR